MEMYFILSYSTDVIWVVFNNLFTRPFCKTEKCNPWRGYTGSEKNFFRLWLRDRWSWFFLINYFDIHRWCPGWTQEPVCCYYRSLKKFENSLKTVIGAYPWIDQVFLQLCLSSHFSLRLGKMAVFWAVVFCSV